MSDKERAKQIIVEIVRLSGGRLESMTRLFKAFYFAHLFYSQRQPGYLSDWPLIHMRRGPGIRDADILLDELRSEGRIDVQLVPEGPYQRREYRTTEKDVAPEPLSLEAIDAIRDSVFFVKNKSVTELRELTHEYSRSWRSTKDGDELDIYLDLQGDEEYCQREALFDKLSPMIDDIFAG
jgi:hypothetical protein